MSKLILVPFLLGLAAPLSAQEAAVRTLRGRILDGSTAQPVPAAQVEIPGTQIGGITDDDGFYALEMPVGAIEADVLVSALGYEARQFGDVALELHGETARNVVLEWSPVAIVCNMGVWSMPAIIAAKRASDASPHGRASYSDGGYGLRTMAATTWSVTFDR